MTGSTLSPALRETFEHLLEAPISSITPLSGGDINAARKVETASGAFFVKLNELPQAPEMFRTEAEGLKLLGQSGPIAAPAVIATGQAAGTAFLLMEYIRPGKKTPAFWDQFGRSLAHMHQEEQNYFGLPFDNYIGSLPQYNGRYSDFNEFYIEKRLEPQLSMALEKGLLNASDASHMKRLYTQLDKLLPVEPPALIHGDLWGGNYLVDEKERGVLIDPAVAFAHREMDLAMSRLFGGFDDRFYHAYQEIYPTEKGLNQRISIYQLYYLLVHVNLFGGSYVGSVRRIIKHY